MAHQINKLNIETPDHVDLEFKIAGPGARFLAYTLDICLQVAFFALLFTIIVSFWIVITSLVEWYPDLSKETLDRIDKLMGYGALWIIGIIVFLYGVVTLGYFAIFEYLDHGRTPGKKWINIRVMRSDGLPLAPWNVIVRNVLRVIDIFMCCSPVGLVFMLVDRLNRRLGDLAGGTVVVIDKSTVAPSAGQLHFDPATVSNEMKSAVAGMSPETYKVLVRFLERMNELDPQQRERLGKTLHEKIFGEPPQSKMTDRGVRQSLELVAALYREKTRVL